MSRASIFDTDDEPPFAPQAPGNPHIDDIDITGFAPTKPNRAADRHKLASDAAGQGYLDRAPPARQDYADTRHRTGRNIQLNLKITKETEQRFNQLSRGQIRAVTFEQAIDALWRERFG